MKIATWNVNSVKARLETVVQWLKEAEPDVVCFQEIKSTDETFPADAFQALGQCGFLQAEVLRRIGDVA